MDKVSKTRKEVETEIKDIDGMEIYCHHWVLFLLRLFRRKGKFQARDFYISLDEVRDLGHFIEVEIGVKESRNFQEKVESIFRFMGKLGISREFKYPQIISGNDP